MTPAEAIAEHSTSDSVATGVIAAERRAQADIARRRRLLIGGAALGLVVALAALAIMTALQQQANNQAREGAQRASARAAFAEDVVLAAEDYKPIAATVDTQAGTLRDALEQHLAETERSDAELAAQASTASERLLAASEAIAALTARDVPQPPELVDADRAVEVLVALETLRAEANALSGEIEVAVRDAEQWLATVSDVNQALAAHIEQVEAEATTSDPGELISLWRDERPALLRLSVAATAADDLDGLGPWARAHADYADGVGGWIDEAVTLLDTGEIDTYNERFDEVFGVDDPFGFGAAVAAATDDALTSPSLLQLGTLQERAQLVLEAITATEVTVSEVLDDDLALGSRQPSTGATSNLARTTNGRLAPSPRTRVGRMRLRS